MRLRPLLCETPLLPFLIHDDLQVVCRAGQGRRLIERAGDTRGESEAMRVGRLAGGEIAERIVAARQLARVGDRVCDPSFGLGLRQQALPQWYAASELTGAHGQP